MTGSSTDFLFGKDLEAILSLINSNKFFLSIGHLKVYQWSQKHLLKCPLKNLRLSRAWNAPKHSRLKRALQCHFWSKYNKKDLHAFEDQEFILPKSKLKHLIQLKKEKNQITGFSRDSSIYATHTTDKKLCEPESYFQNSSPYFYHSAS